MKLRPTISLIAGISSGLLLVKAANIAFGLLWLRENMHGAAAMDTLRPSAHEIGAGLLAVLLFLGGMSAAACVGFLRRAPWAFGTWILYCVCSVVGLSAAALWLGLPWGYPLYALAVAVVWFGDSLQAAKARHEA